MSRRYSTLAVLLLRRFSSEPDIRSRIYGRLVCVLLAIASVGVTPVRGATRARCLEALGGLPEAKLDQFIEDIWAACPCDWDEAAPRPRSSFVTCVKAAARAKLPTSTGTGELPFVCYATVRRAAKLSTCGLVHSLLASTCCLPDGRCKVVKRLPGDATANPPVPAVSGADRCLAYAGATLGASQTCYDACPPPGMQRCTMEVDTDAAMDRAKESIAAFLGRPYDVMDPVQVGWILLQTPHEHPCFMAGRVTKDFGPRPPETAVASNTTGPPGCTTDCMPPFDDAGRRYCGWGSARRQPWIKHPFSNLIGLKNVRCDRCLNEACWFHDGCAGQYCTKDRCMFANPPSIFDPNPTAGDNCTKCFFGKMAACSMQARQDGRFDDADCIRMVQNVAHEAGERAANSGECSTYPMRTHCPKEFPTSGGYCDCESFCMGCNVPSSSQEASSGVCCAPQERDFCVPIFAPCVVGTCDPTTHLCPYECPDPICRADYLFLTQPGCGQSDGFAF
jgi:hypothetical protein